MTDAAVSAPPTPYKGLASFGDTGTDSLLFFGREREIEVIAANLVAARLTVLYGPSGVGKTSLLRAGVAPRLRAEGAAVVVFTAWSGDPASALTQAVGAEVGGGDAESLAAAVARTREVARDLYVILDQFEEYFLYHDDATPIADVADVIRDRGLRANFLLSIREDTLAQLDAFKARIPNLFGNSLRLDRLDRRAARRAILGPLERYNELWPGEDRVDAEPALVEEVLESVAVGRIQLGAAGRGGTEEIAGESELIEAPYLQLVLERLWSVERELGSQRLRLETLQDMGGATRVVEDHLERAMAELSTEEKDAAAAMYNHLVTPSGTKIAHRAGDLARYAEVEEEEAGRVLDRLALQRIVRAAEDGAGGPQYEIFHDVLADAVLAWRARYEAERRIDAERRAASKRHRRTLGVAVALGLVLAVVAGVAVYAFAQRESADENAREARANDLTALAEATLATSPERSLALALEASDVARTPPVENALRRALRTLRTTAVLPAGSAVSDLAYSADGRFLAAVTANDVRLYRTTPPHRQRRLQHRARAVAFSADGRRFVTAGVDGVARVWRTSSGAQLLRLRHRGRVTSAVFSSDASLLATSSDDAHARIWNANTGALLRSLRHPNDVTGVDFNRNGTLVVTTANGRLARVVDVRTGRVVARLRHRGRIVVARFSPNADVVATAGADKLGGLWDARTGRRRAELRGHVRGLLWVAFSRDGRLVATSSTDATARVWTVANGTPVAVLPGHTNFVRRLEFSPSGELIVSGSRDRTARVFDADAATSRATLAGHRAPLMDVAFAPGGRTVATASNDGTVRIWDAQPFPDLLLSRPRKHAAADVAFARDGAIAIGRSGETLSADGTRAAATGHEGSIVIRDVRSSTIVTTIAGAGRTTALGLSADGSRLVAADRTGAIRVWRTHDARLELTVHSPRAVTAVAISPDLSRVAGGGPDGIARIWTTDGARPEHVLRGHRGPLRSATFSRDGRLLVTTAADHDARLWDVQTGREIWMLPHTAKVSDADFSADGRWVAIAGPGYAGIVDAKTGERILLLNGHDRVLTSIAFSATGWRIATAGEKGVVRTYDCRVCGGIDTLVHLAEERLSGLRGAS